MSDKEMDIVRAHVFIEGRVQGVFYRANTYENARLLNIKGWVKNCRDGRVEAIFEGKSDDVEKIIKWCHKGPPGAIVRDVKVMWEETKGEYSNFSIKY